MKGFLSLSLAACIPAVFFLSQPIDVEIYDYMKNKGTVDAPFYVKFLGEGTSILSYMSVLQADLYFHGGAGHFFEEHAERPALMGGEGAKLSGYKGADAGIGTGVRGHDEHCGHSHKPGGAVHPGIPAWNILLKISGNIAVTEHTHLSDDKIQEMLPWLYYAVKLDTHNVEAYTVTSYWLADRLRKAKEALDLLKEGLKNNPDSWEISAEIGRLYFQHYKKFQIAENFMSRAYELLMRTDHDKFQERYILSFWAYSAEAAGDKDTALKAFRRVKELFPNSLWCDEKIAKLKV